MNCEKLTSLLNGLLIILILAIPSCSGSDPDDPGQNPPPPPPGGDVTITGISPGDHFWGDEITISGTGFSTTKEQNIVKFVSVFPSFGCSLNYTSDGGDIEIVSASATQIKIKVPVKIINDIPYCGPEKLAIEITVGDKKAKIENIQFYGGPYVDSFLYHWGWFDIPSVTRIDDSVMIAGGMRGFYARESPYWDKIRLSINGSNIPIKFRTVGLESGWAFFLPTEDFAELNCDKEPDDWGARYMDFEFSLEGTGKKSGVKKLYVQYLPNQTANCSNCPPVVSKTGGGGAAWEVTGKNMYYTKVRFSPLNCGGPSQDVDLSPPPSFGNMTSFSIPLSILSANCSYSVTLVDPCDGGKNLGTVSISP